MPRNIQKFLTKMGEELSDLLGNNLFGIYIYGSLICGNFRSKSSDIDCIAVTNKKLTKREFELLKKWYSKLLKENYEMTKRLEMSYAVKNRFIKPGISKSPYFFHCKFMKNAVSDANNPIVWLNIKNNGITILGPKPKEFVPTISLEVLKKALKARMDYIIKRYKKYLNGDWSKVYVILTFCRIFYTLKTQKITSKEKAAIWCLKHLPKTYRPIVSSASKAFNKAANWKNLNHPTHGINERHRKSIILLGEYISKELRKISNT